MSQSKAEQVEIKDDLDLRIEESLKETNEESVPQEVETPEVEKPEAGKETVKEESEEKGSTEDRIKKRIDKVTSDKYKERRRADALQVELDQLKAKPAEQKQTAEPTLESCDFDEARFNSELMDYKVDQKFNSEQQKQQVNRDTQAQADINDNFNKAAETFATDNKINNFNEIIGNIPTLQPAVLQAVMEDKKGPELAHYLGTHLDDAYKISEMNPIAAAIEIGRISAKLAEPKQIKTSSAPDPIEEIASGGVIENDIGDTETSIDDWMRANNP